MFVGFLRDPYTGLWGLYFKLPGAMGLGSRVLEALQNRSCCLATSDAERSGVGAVRISVWICTYGWLSKLGSLFGSLL